MKQGKQWIHFDAQYPLDFGHDVLERFGPVGQLLFVQFLCACKRSFPQGQIQYRTEAEARVLLGAPYPFVDGAGVEWSLDDFWKWCGYRKVTRTWSRQGRRIVCASRWEYWEKSAASSTEATRKRRSRAKKVPEMSGHVSGHFAAEVGGGRLEVGGGRLEVGGGNGNGRVGTAAVAILEKLKDQQPTAAAPVTSGCGQCGFMHCECPLQPRQVREVLRENGWRREGECGKWLPPPTDE